MGEGREQAGPGRGMRHGLPSLSLPLVDQETFEQFEALAEEVATIEIPAPVHYPPSPPSTFVVPDFIEGETEADEPVTPVMSLPPRPPTRELEYAEGELPASFSFACGGWLQFYMFGVAKCIKHHKLHTRAKFAGCSAGALTALGLAVEEGSYDRAVEYCKKICIPQCRRTLKGPFMLDKYVRGCLDYSGGLDGWRNAVGRLHVAVTRLPDFGNMRFSHFDSKEELIKALLASAAAFPLAPPVHYKGKWYIDGGISDFQPVLEPDTVTVNPFYFSQADIRPSRYVPAWWSLLPPSNAATVDWLFDLGYCDALRWMGRANLDHMCKNKCRRDPSDPLSCKHRPERDPHPFDCSTRTFKRFLGYGRWPGAYAGAGKGQRGIVDHFTLVLVATVWRTAAFALIYAELATKLVVVGAVAVARETAAVWAGVLMVLVLLLPSVQHVLIALGLLLATHAIVQGPAGTRQWQAAAELARTLCSLTLLLRAIPLVGTRVHLRKHHKLFRQSLIYRIAVHIV